MSAVPPAAAWAHCCAASEPAVGVERGLQQTATATAAAGLGRGPGGPLPFLVCTLTQDWQGREVAVAPHKALIRWGAWGKHFPLGGMQEGPPWGGSQLQPTSRSPWINE